MSVLGYRVGSLGTGWYCCCETARVDYYSYAVRKCVLGAFFQASKMLGICGDCTRASRLLSKYGCPGGDDSSSFLSIRNHHKVGLLHSVQEERYGEIGTYLVTCSA